MEQVNPQQEQPQQQPTEAAKSNVKTWWILGGVGCLVVILLSCLAAILAYVVSNNIVNMTTKADTAAAQVVLRNAVADAEQFAADSNGSYDGMAAGDLADIDSSISWVDGDPGAGEVGVIDAGEDTFTFTYKDDTGAAFRAIRRSDGTVKYIDSSGKSL